MLGEPLRQKASQFAHLQARIRPRTHISRQLLDAAGKFMDSHRGLAYRGMGIQGDLDFAEFHAMAANFHLGIAPAQIFIIAVRRPAPDRRCGKGVDRDVRQNVRP